MFVRSIFASYYRLLAGAGIAFQAHTRWHELRPEIELGPLNEPLRRMIEKGITEE